MAARAELRQPGILERSFGSMGGGFGLGRWFLTTMAASFIGTAAAQTFFGDPAHGSEDAFQEGYEGSDPDGSATGGEGTEAGGSFGESGWGGGDFGGGDFGGGDFGI